VPGLGRIEVLSPDECYLLNHRNQRELDRPSPDGRFLLRLSDPWEFAMGAEVWGRVQLFDQGQDVTSEHAFLGDWHGVLKYGVLYPWDQDSSCLALPVLWGDNTSSLVLYDVALRSERHRLDVWPFQVVWSPASDSAFLRADEGTELFNASGQRQRFPCGPVGSLFAGWTPSGRHIALPLGEEKQNVTRSPVNERQPRHWTRCRCFPSMKSDSRNNREVGTSLTRCSTPAVPFLAIQ